MDPIIEEGYARLLETLEDLQAKKEESAGKVRESMGPLLARMAADTAPAVERIGLEMLRRAKREASGDLYEQDYYEKKMIVLGKTDPLPYRPDDPTMPVHAQICVLSADGNFYEVMYTNTEIRVDSCLSPLTPEETFEVYGYDLVVMLYRALFEYAQKEEELTAALARTLDYLRS
ncbi:hypothetical protein F8E02_07145 [Methanoculleus sp. Wushi-C6]|uniref:Uncharacterized protein n=1 Tax=Methanoculleus caldifontis TaxID=2651577 RepID=A0ABU3X156_9EURY|nr:hypothetical protein [Methanoculleus sp. Wushi-C6]MDV2481784.1 hypothetical protein [Methanoculleus sp. Wushi-C6]